MPVSPDDCVFPAELARRLAAQAELLALSAAMEASRFPLIGPDLLELADQARDLVRLGNSLAERQDGFSRAVAQAGRVIDEGLAGWQGFDPPDGPSRLTH
jgi:hypothetical protein